MSEIPVNIRVIGEPKGEELLYFEDYVYTFMKRILEECRRQECEVAFYGTRTYRNGTEVYIISGAIHIQKEQPKQDYFAAHTLLGSGWIERGRNNDICVNLITQDKKKIQKEDFYIYYAQNEEMQNYMVGWNQNHHGTRNRIENSEAVRYTRMVQNYNREEVKISFLWNVINVLGLSFIVCVMVYAIVFMNQYYKMKDMEENLAYVISVMSDSVQMQAVNSEKSVQEEEGSEIQEKDGQATINIEESEQEQVLTTRVTIEEEDTEEITTYIQILTEEVQETIRKDVEQEDISTQVSDERQYIVQEGDTLRSIAYAHYGTYDMVKSICIKNEITNPNNILCGQKLLLP